MKGNFLLENYTDFIFLNSSTFNLSHFFQMHTSLIHQKLQYINYFFFLLINLFFFSINFLGDGLFEILGFLMENEELAIISPDIPRINAPSNPQLFSEFSNYSSNNSEDASPRRNSWFEEYIKIPLKSFLSKIGFFGETNSVATELVSPLSPLLSQESENENMLLSPDCCEIKKSWFHNLFISPFEYFLQKLGFCKKDVVNTIIPETVLEPSVPQEIVLEPSVPQEIVVSNNRLELIEAFKALDYFISDLECFFELDSEFLKLNKNITLIKSLIMHARYDSQLRFLVLQAFDIIEEVAILRYEKIHAIENLLVNYEKIAPNSRLHNDVIEKIKLVETVYLDGIDCVRVNKQSLILTLDNPQNLSDRRKMALDSISFMENKFVDQKQKLKMLDFYIFRVSKALKIF